MISHKTQILLQKIEINKETKICSIFNICTYFDFYFKNITANKDNDKQY